MSFVLMCLLQLSGLVASLDASHQRSTVMAVDVTGVNNKPASGTVGALDTQVDMAPHSGTTGASR